MDSGVEQTVAECVDQGEGAVYEWVQCTTACMSKMLGLLLVKFLLTYWARKSFDVVYIFCDLRT